MRNNTRNSSSISNTSRQHISKTSWRTPQRTFSNWHLHAVSSQHGKQIKLISTNLIKTRATFTTTHISVQTNKNVAIQKYSSLQINDYALISDSELIDKNQLLINTGMISYQEHTKQQGHYLTNMIMKRNKAYCWLVNNDFGSHMKFQTLEQQNTTTTHQRRQVLQRSAKCQQRISFLPKTHLQSQHILLLIR